MRVPFQKFSRRVSGFSLPIVGGGLQWEAKEAESQIVYDLICELEDRRVLYTPHHLEVPGQVESSVVEIRHHCTEALKRLDRDSPVTHPIRIMRAACRAFLTPDPDRFRLAQHWVDYHRHRPDDFNADFFVRLGEMRATFGHQLAILSSSFELDLEEDLLSILPRPSDDSVPS